MSLLDTSVMQQISDNLGQAFGKLVAYESLTDFTTPIALVSAARAIVQNSATDADFTSADAYASALHGVVATLPSTLSALLLPTPHAIEAYVVGQAGAKVRTYFKSGVNWSDNFRALWSQATGEELIVRLGELTNTSGTWNSFTPDKTISVDELLQIIIPVTIGAVPITLSLSLHHANPGLSDQVFNFTIPSNTTSGTVVTIGNMTDEFVSVRSAIISGGSGGDRVEVWVA